MQYARPYKPQMRHILSFSEIPVGLDTVLSAKCDGEFDVLAHKKEGTWTHNLWDTKRFDLPCIAEARAALIDKKIGDALMLTEIYGVDKEGYPMKLPEFIHTIRSGDKKLVHLGIFDLLTLEGKPVSEPYLWRLQELEEWFQGCTNVGPVNYIQVHNRQEIEEKWQTWVVEGRYEGLVARSGDNWYKLKKVASVDAVIIGINKKPSYANQEVTSIKVAVMDDKKRLIEVGDVASGIDYQLRHALWQLTKNGVRDTRETLYVEPIVVVEVEFTETFEAEKNVYAWKGKRLELVGQVDYYSMRHPRLKRFRTDKKARIEDINIDQIGGIQE